MKKKEAHVHLCKISRFVAGEGGHFFVEVVTRVF